MHACTAGSAPAPAARRPSNPPTRRAPPHLWVICLQGHAAAVAVAARVPAAHARRLLCLRLRLLGRRGRLGVQQPLPEQGLVQVVLVRVLHPLLTRPALRLRLRRGAVPAGAAGGGSGGAAPAARLRLPGRRSLPVTRQVYVVRDEWRGRAGWEGRQSRAQGPLRALGRWRTSAPHLHSACGLASCMASPAMCQEPCERPRALPGDGAVARRSTRVN